MIRRGARCASELLSGAVGAVIASVLAILGLVGTFLTAADLLRLTVDPALVLLPAALLVGANVLYRTNEARKQAEHERDEAMVALAARPDPKDVTRAFLERQPSVFHVKVPYEDGYIEEGSARVGAWLDRCEALIYVEAPHQVPAYRAAAQLDYLDGRIPWVRVDDDPKHYDISTPRLYSGMVVGVQGVLREIIEERPATPPQ